MSNNMKPSPTAQAQSICTIANTSNTGNGTLHPTPHGKKLEQGPTRHDRIGGSPPELRSDHPSSSLEHVGVSSLEYTREAQFNHATSFALENPSTTGHTTPLIMPGDEYSVLGPTPDSKRHTPHVFNAGDLAELDGELEQLDGLQEGALTKDGTQFDDPTAENTLAGHTRRVAKSSAARTDGCPNDPQRARVCCTSW